MRFFGATHSIPHSFNPSLIESVAKHKPNNVCAHLQSLNVLLHRVVVDTRVFPAVAKVTLVAEEADKPPVD